MRWIIVALAAVGCVGQDVQALSFVHDAELDGGDAFVGDATDAGPDGAADVSDVADADADAPPACADDDGDGHPSTTCGGDDCDDGDPAVHPSAPEACNLRDDDCDDEIDEGLPPVIVFPDADGDGWGDSAAPTIACGPLPGLVPDGRDCRDDAPDIHPGARERCNGVDDNCDGIVDEELPVRLCENQTGACEGAVARCGGEVGWLACDAGDYAMASSAYELDELTCDGLDNDCDGETDEGMGATTCGIGACARTVENCIGGVSAACVPGEPLPETCGDGTDDDCDGATDENPPCVCRDGERQACWTGDPARRGVGACVDGEQLCVGASRGPCEGEGRPTAEVCNGLDDDCDGLHDEGLGETTCGVGACRRTARNCVGGVPQACEPGEPVPEACDGLVDDDCDGEVDEGCACRDGDVLPCGSEVGECVAGMQTCAAGAWGACEGNVGPAPEACDGVDNDCDGMIDEGLGTTSCGMGACRRTVQNCAMGMPQMCVPGAPSPEVCDMVDNDCDGVVDDIGGRFVCGDGCCNCGETTGTCGADCGPQVCGDGVCTGSEGLESCPADCRLCFTMCGAPDGGRCPGVCGRCGDGICYAALGENAMNCPADCVHAVCP